MKFLEEMYTFTEIGYLDIAIKTLIDMPTSFTSFQKIHRSKSVNIVQKFLQCLKYSFSDNLSQAQITLKDDNKMLADLGRCWRLNENQDKYECVNIEKFHILLKNSIFCDNKVRIWNDFYSAQFILGLMKYLYVYRNEYCNHLNMIGFQSCESDSILRKILSSNFACNFIDTKTYKLKVICQSQYRKIVHPLIEKIVDIF